MTPLTAVGYTRVSTREQGDSGLGLEAQYAAIVEECRRRGFDENVVIVEEVASGKDVASRPILCSLLDDLDAGKYDVLVVAKVDRLSRSIVDFATLMEEAQRGGWKVVAIDLGVDTSTPQGELMANIMATFAQFERRLIGQRTRDALAAKKAQGVKLGRPSTVPREIVDRITWRRERHGETWESIARGLNIDKIEAPRGGGEWYATSVRRIYLGACRAALES